MNTSYVFIHKGVYHRTIGKYQKQIHHLTTVELVGNHSMSQPKYDAVSHLKYISGESKGIQKRFVTEVSIKKSRI